MLRGGYGGRRHLAGGSVVLTTGTFLGGLIHLGSEMTPAGRVGRHLQMRWQPVCAPWISQLAAEEGTPAHLEVEQLIGQRWKCSRPMTHRSFRL